MSLIRGTKERFANFKEEGESAAGEEGHAIGQKK